MPLEHVEAAKTVLLYLEIESYLKDLPKLGLPIVLTGGSWGASRPNSSKDVQRRVREARRLAELGSHVTLDACRRGGVTGQGGSGVTEFEGMSALMHKSPGVPRSYVKRPETQRTSAAVKRRIRIEKSSR